MSLETARLRLVWVAASVWVVVIAGSFAWNWQRVDDSLMALAEVLPRWLPARQPTEATDV
jgi:hypothetical protein